MKTLVGVLCSWLLLYSYSILLEVSLKKDSIYKLPNSEWNPASLTGILMWALVNIVSNPIYMLAHSRATALRSAYRRHHGTHRRRLHEKSRGKIILLPPLWKVEGAKIPPCPPWRYGYRSAAVNHQQVVVLLGLLLPDPARRLTVWPTVSCYVGRVSDSENDHIRPDSALTILGQFYVSCIGCRYVNESHSIQQSLPI